MQLLRGQLPPQHILSEAIGITPLPVVTSSSLAKSKYPDRLTGMFGGNLRCEWKINFRTIRSLQYTIPAVGHHYGNAFAPDGEDDDDDEDGLGPVTLGTYSQSMNVASTTDGECYDEEEEEMDVSLASAFCFAHWGDNRKRCSYRRTS